VARALTSCFPPSCHQIPPLRSRNPRPHSQFSLGNRSGPARSWQNHLRKPHQCGRLTALALQLLMRARIQPTGLLRIFPHSGNTCRSLRIARKPRNLRRTMVFDTLRQP
jgi:hypothetical protein